MRWPSRHVNFAIDSALDGPTVPLQRISGRGLGSGAPADAAKMDYLSYLYTPQQMSGGASFGHATRVGNWSEDYELQQHRIKCAHGRAGLLLLCGRPVSEAGWPGCGVGRRSARGWPGAWEGNEQLCAR